jgi:hypothetical protein
VHAWLRIRHRANFSLRVTVDVNTSGGMMLTVTAIRKTVRWR